MLLQSGDPETRASGTCSSTRVSVILTELSGASARDSTSDDVVGESHYNPLLPTIVRDLAEKGLLVESETLGASFLRATRTGPVTRSRL